MRVPEALGALDERPFRLLFAAQTASFLGDQIAPIAIAFAVIGLGGSATDLGVVLAAMAVPMVLLILPAGTLADRFGRRRIMIASDLISLTAQGVLAALLVAGQARLWQLVALQAVHGCATALFLPASTGLVPETVTPGRLQQANALRYLSFGATGVIGPALAGVLVATAGSGWALAVDAATFATSAILLSRLPALRVATAPAARFLGDLVEGWREVRSRSWVWVSILYFAVFQLVVFGSFYVLGPIVAEGSLDGASSWAVVVSCFGLGSVVGSVLALRLRARRPLATAFLASLAFAPALAMLGFPATVPALAAAWAIAGVAFGLGGVLWETTLQQRIPIQSLSRVSAYDWLGSIAMRPVGYIAVGPVAALVGVDTTLWLGAALLTAAAAITLSVPSIRRIEGTEAQGLTTSAHGDPGLVARGD